MQVKWTKSAQKRLDKAIGICYEGGLDEEGHPKDTRTLLQKAALVALINKLREAFYESILKSNEHECFGLALV